ncbi:Glycine zipper [Chitinophaga jiangningensis]|uniref:Glycine zipper n=1 Tax=Chitinophaga jiangningensis TaxID=1419482 RepID=A0A1M7LTV9_9BACT|nr:glycine zipper domain-containing protein [Chitinophaga jiangningensis]SHM81609.1 Glycine zipper [Chitinophaga jiangningensis]
MRQTFVAVAAALVLFSCKSQPDQAAIEAAKQATIDSINNVNLVKQQMIDSMNHVGRKHSKSAANESGFSPAEYEAPADGTTAAAAPAETKKKKGFSSWSHTAKGAVVGAGAGAVTGAIVNKDRVKGAAIGTIIGAGVGAGTGAIVDHAKKKKEQQ